MVKLTKYGFIRNKAEDFSDDGNRFRVYSHPQYPGIRVTHHHSEAYGYFISARMEYNNKLTYKEYSILPGYKDLDLLNGGYSEEQVLENMDTFLQAIDTFFKAYQEAANNLTSISDEQIIEEYSKVQNILKNRLSEIDELLTKENLLNLLLNGSSWNLNNFKDYYKLAKEEINRYSPESAVKLSQTSRREFIQKTNKEPSDYYTKQLKSLLIK